MAAKKGIKLLTEILNIEGIKVISQQHEGIEIILQIEPIGKESVCSRSHEAIFLTKEGKKSCHKYISQAGNPAY